MLTNVTVAEVKRIAELARQAADARDRLLSKVHLLDLGEQTIERGSRNPTDLDALNVLESTVNTAEIGQLKAAIDALPEEARLELKAVMLVGRGDFAPAEWDAAVDLAQGTPASGDVEYLAEKVALADYLNKGLFALNCL
jgi:hypothetical protein